jgi:hypothetical protein
VIVTPVTIPVVVLTKAVAVAVVPVPGDDSVNTGADTYATPPKSIESELTVLPIPIPAVTIPDLNPDGVETVTSGAVVYPIPTSVIMTGAEMVPKPTVLIPTVARAGLV